MKSVVIGDIHLRDIPGNPQYLKDQISTITNLFPSSDFKEVIFLGDVFHFRKPSPTELLAFREILDAFYPLDIKILRGNHDSESKADDGRTVLKIFEDFPTIKIYDHIGFDDKRKRAFIPHYEDTNRIRECLATVPDSYCVFGHFGYSGCYNSIGDYDSDIPASDFNNHTILGHIHWHHRANDKLHILGTPYSTEYYEGGKSHYYAVVDENNNFTYHEIKQGLRHFRIDLDDMESYEDALLDKNYFTYLQVYVNQIKNLNARSIRKDIFRKYPNIRWVDIKFRSLVDDKLESNFDPTKPIFTIDDTLIEKYVNETKCKIPKKRLMEGLEILKYEDN